MKSLLFMAIALLSLNSWGQAVVTVAPMKQEVKILDKPVEYTFYVRNETSRKIPVVKIDLLDTAVDLEKSIVDTRKTIEKKNPFKPYKEYVRIPSSEISLEPNEVKKIKVVVLPKKDMDGSAYVSLRIYPKESKGQSGIATVVAFFHNILIYNPPTEKKVLSSKFISYKNDKVTLELENSGNTFLRPTAKVSVIKNGKVVSFYDAVNNKNITEILVLPGGKTEMYVSVPKKILTPGSKLLVALYDKNKKYVNSQQVDIK